MPTIAVFYGIVITMYRQEHPPPHFHATYGGSKVVVQIDPLRVMAGQLPPRALSMVLEWAARHQDELKQNWERAQAHRDLVQVAPLA